MHACKQVLRPQVQVPKPQVRVQVQVPSTHLWWEGFVEKPKVGFEPGVKE